MTNGTKMNTGNIYFTRLIETAPSTASVHEELVILKVCIAVLYCTSMRQERKRSEKLFANVSSTSVVSIFRAKFVVDLINLDFRLEMQNIPWISGATFKNHISY